MQRALCALPNFSGEVFMKRLDKYARWPNKQRTHRKLEPFELQRLRSKRRQSWKLSSSLLFNIFRAPSHRQELMFAQCQAVAKRSSGWETYQERWPGRRFVTRPVWLIRRSQQSYCHVAKDDAAVLNKKQVHRSELVLP